MQSPSSETISSPASVEPSRRSVVIRDFQSAVAARWDEFVYSQPGGSLFHLMGWKRAIEKTFGFQSCYYYAERDGQITGILPLFLVNNWIIGRCLHSVPFGVYGGICAADQESHDALLASVKQLAVAKQVEHLDLHQRDGELLPDFHSNTLYVAFTTQLSANTEANLKKLPRDTRYMIRKGEKAGLRAQHGLEQLNDFYPLFCESMRRLGTPVFPFALFKNLLEEFSSQADLTMIYSGAQPVSAVLSFTFRDTFLPYYAGANHMAPPLAANNFMYWHLMKHAAEQGFRVFDFGRSKKNTGAYQFKSQWGMTAETLNYQVYLVRRKTVPNFSPVNPKFEMATRVWRQLPMGLTKSLGPRVVRWFP
ncbi:MAG: FemAB family XrtA/PEP-CTERM system-associated protein [Candidatus Acidiferrum sp.]